MAAIPVVEEALPRELAEARFSRLYRDHEREILRYALRRSGEPQDAADVVAETFLVAWRRLGEVPGDGEARLWLYATARRVLANHQRGIKRRTRLAERLREELRRQFPPEPDADRTVLDALAAMTAADRELLMLVAMEGLSPSEAARVLGVSTVAARTRLHRARRRLRARLGEASEETTKRSEIEMGEAR